MFRLPVVDPLFPRVWGTVDEDPEPAQNDVCIDEYPLHIAGAALLRVGVSVRYINVTLILH